MAPSTIIIAAWTPRRAAGSTDGRKNEIDQTAATTPMMTISNKPNLDTTKPPEPSQEQPDEEHQEVRQYEQEGDSHWRGPYGTMSVTLLPLGSVPASPLSPFGPAGPRGPRGPAGPAGPSA